ncbi:BldC family transcriptional regulator [Oerskovia sp. Root22]|uniref:BldC family transcriptional regulator n=1 Tax=Oerskovia sp. Root22 TaxID=1736494 RepID=UPI0006FF4FB7|nr:BldC family transcriptional regulator [Oerskovia sp. Root22]KRC43003.1 hypothetical protein ASE15_03325 [Oerskovia sp. Root22]
MDYLPHSTLLTTAEVARIFRVGPRTVHRWAVAGKLSTIRTMGGHRRYYRHEIEALVRNGFATQEGGS